MLSSAQSRWLSYWAYTSSRLARLCVTIVDGWLLALLSECLVFEGNW